MKRQDGFTLLEVLVALTILAVAAAGLMGAMGQGARQLERLRDKTFAHWVASNKLAELRALGNASSGSSEETAFMAGRMWSVRVNISDTANPGMRRADIDVAGAEGKAATLTGFLGKF